ncbi:MAG: RagB/SusD family nutrient uptake outer membrane protein [Bacteroidia bacterium 43-41]|nr:MAG: RagB/SusD family nutrient uptake outer membrane protein [Bacteroidia bacterium 43-41]
MKNKILYSFLLSFAFILFSCSLDENPADQMPESEAFKSPVLIYLNTVANLYTEIGGSGGSQGLAGPDRGIYDLNTFTADEALLPTRGGDWFDGGLWQDIFKHNWKTDNSVVKGSWDYLYRVIGKTNQSLDKLNSLIEESPENPYLPVYKAEVRAIRAMYYYYLMDLYARVPIVETATVKIADVKQSNRSEVFAFVKKELEESIPFLSTANSSKQGEYYGRMTRPVAFYLMAKLALNAQVYGDDNWTDNNGIPNGTATFNINGANKTPWEATIAYCDSIIALGYTLESDFSKNFSVTNESSKENIFVIPMDPVLYSARNMNLVRSRHYAHAKAYSQDGWNGSSATKEALAIFRKGSEDPRMKKTYFLGKVYGPDGNPVMDGDKELEYKPDAIALDVSGTPNEKTAGARMAKYEFDNTAQAGGQLVHNDWVLFRYADVLLMKSEALVRAGQNGDAELQQVRGRVDATARTATLNNILDERLLEFAWEGLRRQDLIRFGKFHQPISDRPVSAPFRTVFPIPADVLSLNANLTQNPGYTN